MKVAIVGGGLTGLSAALDLMDKTDVVIYERERVLGGLASSYYQQGYHIEVFYHHLFTQDTCVMNLLKKLGLEKILEWRVARVGYAFDSKVYPLNTPLEIMKFPYLTLFDTIRLSSFVLKARYMNKEKFDGISCVRGIKENLGERLYNNFFEPLLRSKFGNNAEKVSYAWLLARVAVRSNRGLRGEKLGYLRGGFQQMIDRMVKRIEMKGTIKIGEGVKRIKRDDQVFILETDMGIEKFDAVISTVPLPVLRQIAAFKLDLPDIKYQSSICGLFALENQLLDDIYWLNVRGDYPFGAVIEHTNLMPLSDYGEHLIYTASYTDQNSPFMSMRSEDIARLHIRGLEKLGEVKVIWGKVAKAQYSGPIYEMGYMKKMPGYRTGMKGLYIAGMFSQPNYPERSMEGSIKAGKECAKVLIKDFFRE